MPRYFFDVKDHGMEVDDLGVDLADVAEARKQALIFAGAILSDDPDLVWDGSELQVRVRDAAGIGVLTVHISATDGPAATG